MPEDNENDSEKLEISRRKFLKWASYVPPTIMSVVISTEPAEAASICSPDENCTPDQTCPPVF